MDLIELGTIGLPDIQRSFVWKNTDVRNLFDSMYRGYPVGYLLFWEGDNGRRKVGTDSKQEEPTQLIIDGQQRLTSLYAVIKSKPVCRESYKEQDIEIAFNPSTERFEVADAAIRRDRSFLPNISILWRSDTDILELIGNYLEGLSSVQEVSDKKRKSIQDSILRLQRLPDFSFTTLTLSSSIDVEQVSDVFVRINSEGTKLGQADFILTLMSAFWDTGRNQLETFCRDARTPPTCAPSPFNYLIKPNPDQLLRAGVGFGFRRARLRVVYSILRGKNIDTDSFSVEKRTEQFEILKKAQAHILDLGNWHAFLNSVQRAGFCSQQMISSPNSLMYVYVFFLIGKIDCKVDRARLEQLTAQWFFMAALTGRYTSSAESTLESDLARFRGVSDAEGFVEVLETICTTALPPDYWTITLPNDLATHTARSPSKFAYFAALNVLDAQALFSDRKVSSLMNPSTQSTRSTLEAHHLFPKKHLQKLGFKKEDTNQIANLTLVEWGANAEIRDQAPVDYTAILSKRFSGEDMERMYYWHALPDAWGEMEYQMFLRERRERMAKVIRDAWEKITKNPDHIPAKCVHASPEYLIDSGEGAEVEFKSTLRTNLHTGQHDPKMELMVLKTIAAFVNGRGGRLLIGVADNGAPVGIGADHFENEDRASLHLANLLHNRIGQPISMYVHSRFDDFEDVRVLIVECTKGHDPVYVKDGQIDRFYIRNGAATIELTGSKIQAYIKSRFNV